jgi:hypothetical protein
MAKTVQELLAAIEGLEPSEAAAAVRANREEISGQISELREIAVSHSQLLLQIEGEPQADRPNTGFTLGQKKAN